ncbi:MAG: TonB-dependent receptor plug domain-containing protein [Bryobacteraceae bacterium]
MEGGTPLVNTVSAQQLHSYSLTEARELPLQNRNFSGLLKVNAGVVPSQGNNGSGVDMNGVGRNGTVYSLDGTSASGNSGGNDPGVYQGSNLVDVMSVEGIDEVNSVKGVIPAEYANVIGGQVNLISRSGTNSWHGSLFENHQNSVLNARFQRAATKPHLTLNQFGGSLGGPIIKNKIFIFGDYEGYRDSEAQFVQGNVPTPSVRNQLLAAVPAYQYALQAFPLPNAPFAAGATVGSYSGLSSLIRNDNHYDAKGDILLTQNARLSISYSHGVPYQQTPRYYVNDPQIYANTLDRGNISYITGGAQWTSETRFGYNRTLQDRLDQFFNLIDPNNTNEAIPYGRRLPDLQTNLGWSGPPAEINHSGGPFWQIEEKFARYAGKHALKFGGDFRRSVGTRNNPQIPDFLYSGLADLLTNSPTQVTATFGSGLYSGRMYDFGGFIQDDWRVTSKLTLNLGFRYDYYSNFIARGEGGTPQAGLYNPSFLSMDGRFNVGSFRSPFSPYDDDAKNFGPRFGFAYSPDGGKTAIRGGGGFMFTNIMPENFWNLVSSAPNIPYRAIFSRAEITTYGITYPQFNDTFFALAQQQIKNSNLTNVAAIFNTQLQNPYTIQYTISVQRQLSNSLLFESAGVGTRGVKFIMWRNANTVNRITGARPNSNLGQPYYMDNSQSSTYYGWQNTLKKRFSNRLSFDVNYTWSKVIANGGGDVGSYYQGENGARNQDFFNLRADRGPTPFDITHYFNSNVVYQTPTLQGWGKPWISKIIGDWQVSAIFRANTGLPVIVTQTSSTPSQRANYIGGDPILSNYQATLKYLNPRAFQLIPVVSASGAPITPGTAGPGIVRAPGLWNLDFSFAKNFTLMEKFKLQIRTDMFNSLNHTNLTGLRNSINDPFFGQLLNTAGARIIQLNARLSF